MKYIVTGGAGFIGSNLIAALNERGEDDILVVDHLGQSEKWRNLVGLRFAEYQEKDDFRAAIQFDRAGHVDVVFHMGACSSTTETNASYLIDNNYRYTRELCEWCLEHNVRFIYASSAATYGDGSQGYSDDDETTQKLRPLNMYGFSKHLFDLWALRHGILDQVVGLKFFNVFGPREDHKGDMRSVAHKAYQQILESGEVRLFRSYRSDYADGEQVRDFVYVKDAVEVALFFADHPERNGLFNCGTGRARTWNDLARAVFAAMDRPVKIRYVDMPDYLQGKYQYHTVAEVTKLKEAGYDRPFTELEEGVGHYVRNWLVKRS